MFFVGAPFVGVLLKGKTTAQRFVFGVMCFMTLNGLLGPGNWGLTIGSIEAYRGHTKGYHFYFNHALAISLITAKWLEDRRTFRWIPPGLGWYLVYCAISFLSIVNAPDRSLAYMTLHKMVFASVLMIAAFNVLRTTDDLKFFVRTMTWTMLWELVVVLKLKYLHGVYQVRGTFEHQNPLAMYSVQIGMIFLASTMGPSFRGATTVLIGFIASAVIVQSTYSRAGLAMFGAGTIAVMMVSLMERLTIRRLATTMVLAVVGLAGIAYSFDRIIERFQDKANVASGELRKVMNQACREMVSDYSLGVGWNNYALMVNPPYRYAEIYYDWDRDRGMPIDETKANPVVESHYYLLLAENGYLGLISYLLFIGVALYRNARSFFAMGHSFERCLSLGIAAGCGLNYVQSTLERVLTQPRNLMLWLILIAVTGRLEVLRRERKKHEKKQGTTVPRSVTAGLQVAPHRA